APARLFRNVTVNGPPLLPATVMLPASAGIVFKFARISAAVVAPDVRDTCWALTPPNEKTVGWRGGLPGVEIVWTSTLPRLSIAPLVTAPVTSSTFCD